MKVRMIKKRTHESDFVKIGFGFDILIFSIFGALPLFARRLFGFGVLLLNLEYFLYSEIATTVLENKCNVYAHGIGYGTIVICIVFVSLNVYLAYVGNKLYAIKLFDSDWEFYDPTSSEAKYAIEKWGLSEYYIKSRYLARS